MLMDVLYIVGLTVLAGACIPLGGLLASFEHIRPNWLEQEVRHFLIALGGGILLGAVSVVLIPEGQSSMGILYGPFPPSLPVGCFSLG